MQEFDTIIYHYVLSKKMESNENYSNKCHWNISNQIKTKPFFKKPQMSCNLLLPLCAVFIVFAPFITEAMGQ